MDGVANFAIRTLTDRILNIFDTGKQVRDILCIYTTDVASAFDVFYRYQIPGIYNIGGGQEYAISLLECIDIINSITGKNSDIQFETERPGDLRYFVCDTSKAKKKLKWKPPVHPRQGIQNLTDWIQKEINLFSGEGLLKR